MDQIKKLFRSMSLKKSLVLIAIVCLVFVSLLSVITILTFSNFQQKILDTRPLIVTNYVVDAVNGSDTECEDGFSVLPQENHYGEFSKENEIYYWCVTALMVALPVLYMIAASVLVAKLYYRLKLQVPLQNLRNGMDHISRQDLDFQIAYHADDELGKLCGTFEKMKDEIYKSNRKMWDMLQERKTLTASVSHDLRTPITVLRGYLDYLDKSIRRESLSSDALQITLTNMTEAVNRLERYVDCVRDIQKIEEIEIQNEVCNLKDFIAGMAGDFGVLVKQQKKQLEIEDCSKTIFFETDKAMLSKVMENIFDNALRFSADKIVLTIGETEDWLLFVVEDDGPGFTSEELSSAASAFYSSAVNGGNFGIGLTISKILCKKLGGALCLENNLGRGAKVTVKIKRTSKLEG